MPFTEHLRELRGRLMVALGTVGVLAVSLFWPSQFVITWLKDEYLGRNIALHAFAPTDVIFTEFRFSLYGARRASACRSSCIRSGCSSCRRFTRARATSSMRIRRRRCCWRRRASLFCHFFIIHRVLTALLVITNGVAEETFGVESTMNLILLTFLASRSSSRRR